MQKALEKRGQFGVTQSHSPGAETRGKYYEVDEFLKSIDLALLKTRFLQNNITDETAILKLTENDLDKMKIPYGQKSKIIQRIKSIKLEKSKAGKSFSSQQSNTQGGRA